MSMRKCLLLAPLALSWICATKDTHAATCPKIDYDLPNLRVGRLSLSLSVKVFGVGIHPSFSCLTANGQRIVARRLHTARRDTLPGLGRVVGWAILSGEGVYYLHYRRMNMGNVSFTAQWPLVSDEAGNIELHPEHPDFKLSYDVKQQVWRALPLGNASDVTVQLRAPVWKSGAQVAPYVEITITDRAEQSIGVSVGRLSLPIELSSGAFYTQAKPGFYLDRQ